MRHPGRHLPAEGGRRGDDYGQASLGSRRQGAPRPHGRRARQPRRREGSDRRQGVLPRREDRARHHRAQGRVAAPVHGDHGHRLDDPDRPRPARADHRRPRNRQDDHHDRHDHQPGEDQQGRARLRGQELPAGLFDLRRRRPEELEHRAHDLGPRGRRRARVHRSSSRRPPPTTPPTSTSPRIPARRWANGSWKTAWTP